MKSLITGGAGFVGSHLTELLHRRGDQVTVLDDLSTGRPKNLAALEGQPRFKFVAGNVLDRKLVARLVDDADAVFHLASAVGVRLIIDEPVKTIETIVDGTDAVLCAARRHQCPVLITSSSEVYGKASKAPFAEDDDVVIGPTRTRRWVYACAKMLDEFLALAHWHEANLPVVCVRLFNTVGPRQVGQYGMVLPRFVRQALAGEPLTVFGDGQQSRCFCHVADAVAAISKLSTCSEACGRVVNVGTAEEVTIADLAKRVIALTESRSPITFVPYNEAYVEGFEDMRRRVPDLTLIRRLIGYEPGHDLDQTLRQVVDYWRGSS